MVAFIAVVTVAAAGATGYVLHVRHRQVLASTAASAVPTTGLSRVQSQPHLVFRSTASGETYGRVAVVPLSEPDGPRAFTTASCDRIHARRGLAVCLTTERGLVTTYRTLLLGADWSTRLTLPLAGLPSRARLSPDGTLAATTAFVHGDSYAQPGQFSTRTLVTTTSGRQLGDLETFELSVDGRVVAAADKNIWGVTFAADDDTFYATAASGGRTWLVRGSLSARTLTGLRKDVECPSLSPDGTRIAFKKRGALPAGQWRIAVFDLRTHTETMLAETRNVDDQLEWLDNAHVLYGVPRAGTAAASSDVWTVPADGTGKPTIFLRDAWSPSVVR
jgi:hypothetical protein